MKLLITLAAFSCLLLSCESKLKIDPQIKTESGTVVAKQYKPDDNNDQTTTGFTSGGHLVFATTHTGSDEKFAVVFRCEHKVIFTINNADVYANVKEGDSVLIQYHEMKNKKGIVKDYDFITATKK